jgi:flagellar biosynthesis protein FlhF
MEVDVKIKRYMADSMRAALDQVRIEQGPDAVILSSRRVNEGIEVIAAVDYDEALIAGAARQYSLAMAAVAAAQKEQEPAPTIIPAPAAPLPRVVPVAPPVVATPPRMAAPTRVASPAPRMAPPPAPRVKSPPPIASAAPVVRKALAPAPAAAAAKASPVPVASTAVKAAAAPAAAPLAPAKAMPRPRAPEAEESHRGFEGMQRELRGLRKLLEDELANFSWHDRRQREPLKTQVLEGLSAMDIAPDVAATLAALTPSRTKLDDTSKIPLALLLRHLPVVDELSTVNAGVYAIVGPTGAGKTTTIAKLAARWTMKHGSSDLALVSTDSYRIGAREQLMTYARILGASMHAPNSGMELARVLERLQSKRLVLIDTAGMGPRDVRLSEQLEGLKLGAPRAKYMLALPAQGEGHALEEIIHAFAPVSPTSCILTKVDEAASLGGVISTTLRHKLKIAYLCNGQRVPEDLHSAHRHRVWLIRAAHKLRDKAPKRRDEARGSRSATRENVHA